MKNDPSKTVIYHVEVDQNACKECGYCIQTCPAGIFIQADYFNEKGYKPVQPIADGKCIGCWKCFFVCPDFAINIIQEDGGEKLETDI